ncbi:hypothetical protein ABK040_010486 [Willaertia magna]
MGITSSRSIAMTSHLISTPGDHYQQPKKKKKNTTNHNNNNNSNNNKKKLINGKQIERESILEINKIYNNQYLIKSKIGEGMNSDCFLGIDQLNKNEHVALKVIPLLGKQTKEQILNEITIMKNLNHLNIVTFKNVFYYKYLDKKYIIIVSEYCNKGSIGDYLEKDIHLQLPYFILLKWMIELIDVLYYCHVNKHVIHRDIKPYNILLTNLNHTLQNNTLNTTLQNNNEEEENDEYDDDDYYSEDDEEEEEEDDKNTTTTKKLLNEEELQHIIIKLGDYGLAKIIEHNNNNNTINGNNNLNNLLTSICGTPLYCCNEIVFGKGYSYNADIYSLGVTLLEIFGGHSHLTFLKIVLQNFKPITTLYDTIQLFSIKKIIQLMVEKDNLKRFTSEKLRVYPNVIAYRDLMNVMKERMNLITINGINVNNNINGSSVNGKKENGLLDDILISFDLLLNNQNDNSINSSDCNSINNTEFESTNIENNLREYINTFFEIILFINDSYKIDCKMKFISIQFLQKLLQKFPKLSFSEFLEYFIKRILFLISSIEIKEDLEWYYLFYKEILLKNKIIIIKYGLLYLEQILQSKVMVSQLQVNILINNLKLIDLNVDKEIKKLFVNYHQLQQQQSIL